MCGSHLVLVTIHGRLSSSIDARQLELVTLNTIISVAILCCLS